MTLTCRDERSARRWPFTSPGLVALAVAMGVSTSGCATSLRTLPDNAPGRPTAYRPVEDAESSGLGIESNDIDSATDLMIRDLLAVPEVANASEPPRIIVDSKYLVNESSSIVNRNLLTDKLRVGLNRAAARRMVFLARERADMIEEERELKEAGVIVPAPASSPLSADYRLAGRIASLDKVQAVGDQTRYTQITFELVDLMSGAILWSNMYEFKKTGRDDAVYR